MTPPPPISDSASLSVEEAAEICSSHAQLMNLMSQLLEWVGLQLSTAPIASATALLGAAPQMGPFVPPITTVGSNEQLLELVAEYEWHAVFAYHAVFFNHWRAEMAAGDYSQWGHRDSNLLSKHVYAHRKSTPVKQSKGTPIAQSTTNPNEPCRKYNNRKCTTSPCPWGHPHTCSTCGKADHSKVQHKD
ncbi:hypothetical protein C0989_007090 [Termitomyces sp. Mn162]|nr:hypothetical protein C0989_007090 [Termitomyces sp. Mn162]